MSKETVKQMFSKIEKENVLRARFMGILESGKNSGEDVLADRIVEFGSGAGFAFTRADLFAARAELHDKENNSKELSEADLEKVAGGVTAGQAIKTAMVTWSILTAGIACAVASIVGSTERDGCAGRMTTSDPNCTK